MDIVLIKTEFAGPWYLPLHRTPPLIFHVCSPANCLPRPCERSVEKTVIQCHTAVNSLSLISCLSIITHRILGCLSRWECVKVREAYDKGGYKRTLEVALKSTLKGDLPKL